MSSITKTLLFREIQKLNGELFQLVGRINELENEVRELESQNKTLFLNSDFKAKILDIVQSRIYDLEMKSQKIEVGNKNENAEIKVEKRGPSKLGELVSFIKNPETRLSFEKFCEIYFQDHKDDLLDSEYAEKLIRLLCKT